MRAPASIRAAVMIAALSCACSSSRMAGDDAGSDAPGETVAERCSFSPIPGCDFDSNGTCPMTEPTEGEACALDPSATCYYCEGDPPESSSAIVEQWQCEGEVWVVYELACGG